VKAFLERFKPTKLPIRPELRHFPEEVVDHRHTIALR
jgi:hypothetical protein